MQSKFSGKKFMLNNSNASVDAKILDVLRSKKRAYISGEELSQELNMSRTAIWKHVNALRALGYRVEATTSMGYKLISSPALLLPLEIKHGLNTKVFGKTIYWEYELNSTNTLALQLAEQGAPEGTVVVSEFQKTGRGRMGRAWFSPPETGIYLSLILRPTFPPTKAPCITFMSAVALVEALEQSLGVHATIKWPNDVMLKNKKVAGILTELRAEIDTIHHIIVGIGINVNNSDFPGTFREKVTSLSAELHKPISRIKIVQLLLQALERWYFITLREGTAKTFNRWQELSSTLGNRVVIDTGGEKLAGLATRIDADGALYIRLDSGEEKQILTGDVMLVANV